MRKALRDYQLEFGASYNAKVAAGIKRILGVSPTGSGKAVMAAAISGEHLDGGAHVLLLVHRIELVRQLAAKLFDNGIDAGIIQAGHAPRPDRPAQVASVQTLHARAIRGSAMSLPPASLVIIDEAHHVRARTYQQIVEAYPHAIILGLTATPVRGDGRGLGNAFDTIIECPQVPELIERGYLVGTTVYAPSVPDLSGIRVEKGDYVHAALEKRMDDAKLVGDIVTEYTRLAMGKKAVVFAAGVGHSIHLRDEFRRAGMLAEHIDGGTPKEERDAILRALSAGTTHIVTNFGVLTEGWDQPDVEVCILARPTKHMGLYRQMVGRVLRPSPGKERAIVLDHAGLVFEHGFVEEPVVWTLREDKKAVNPAHAARSVSSPAERLSACPKCSAVRYGGKPCKVCGWAPAPKPFHVDVRDGELARIDRTGRQVATDSDKLRFYCGLKHIALEREYSEGWAAHVFREKFGDWPDHGWKAAPASVPELHVRSWVRSRQIAWAKRRDRERGAA